MSLAPGTRIGPYEVVSMIGAGGMGEVYRARDTSLKRDVALKILPESFATDSERLARFQREAEVLASLNHPNIAAIYGLEHASGVKALVMELVEGDDLAERIARGAIPMDEALPIARQIAEALEAAHERGIIHRDLKPANIKITPAGAVKVLDFGLAKAIGAEGESRQNSANSPTITSASTQLGVILGTAAYMAPEQAKGTPVDKRADVWAFGCVLFEMISGKRPFEGKSGTDTLVRILEHDPDWSLLPRQTPRAIRVLLERCLRKEQRRRLGDAGVVRIELEDLQRLDDTKHDPVEPLPSHRGGKRLAWVAMALLAITLTAVLMYRFQDSRAPAATIEFEILPPEGRRFTGPAPEFALSPDGRYVAFTAPSGGVSRLWIRSLLSSKARPLPQTEDARSPFWKPDSQAVGFFARNQLKIVHLNGGAPMVVSEAAHWEDSAVVGGAWNRDDVIVFGRGTDPLWQVSAVQTGGRPKALTTLGQNDVAHRWPSFLPDGRRLLFLAQTIDGDELRVASLNGGEPISLGRFESHGVYASGRLFVVRGGNLTSQPFDADRLQLHGEPAHVGRQVGVDAPYQRAMFSLSATGQLAYSTEARTPSRLTWLDRSGRPLGVTGPIGVYINLDIAPDDKRVAVSRMIQNPGATTRIDIWAIDLATDSASPVTDHAAFENDPAWSPDGKQIAFNSNRPHPQKSPYGLFVRASDGAGQDIPLVMPQHGLLLAPDWSGNGAFIVYEVEEDDASGNDLWSVPLTGERTPTRVLESRHDEGEPVLSPDGRWIAYTSNATDRSEVYVRPFPIREGVVVPISRDGGVLPRWRGNSKELFFVALDGRMMVAAFDNLNGRRTSGPERLFPTSLRPGHRRSYDVTADGQRFLLPIMEPSAPITVLLNSPAMLDR